RLIGRTQQRARSRALQRGAHELTPGGCHTHAKGDDQYPEVAPEFLLRRRGCHVRDPDGDEYSAYGMGLRAVTLGHAHPVVVDAVYEAIGVYRAALDNGVERYLVAPSVEPVFRKFN